MISMQKVLVLLLILLQNAVSESDDNERLRIFCANARNLNSLFCTSFCKVFPNLCTPEEAEEDFVPCPPVICENDGVYFLPDPSDCNSYYMCHDKIASRFHCPNNLEWSVSQNKCEWFEMAQCVQQCGPPKPPITKGPCDLNCAGEHNGAFYRHPADCQYFYRCHAGLVFNGVKDKIFKCDDTLHFNTDLNVCDYIEHVDCQENQSCTAPTDADVGIHKLLSQDQRNISCTEKISCEGERTEGLLINDPFDCTKFYICNNQEPIHKECPKGLVFNPQKLECDWWHHYDCEECKETGEVVRYQPFGREDPCTPSCEWKAVGAVFSNPTDCSSYFICAGEGPILLNCPPGSHFDEENKTCQLPELARCSQNLDCF